MISVENLVTFRKNFQNWCKKKIFGVPHLKQGFSEKNFSVLRGVFLPLIVFVRRVVFLIGHIDGAFQWRSCDCEHLSADQLRPSQNLRKMEKQYCKGVTNACVNSNSNLFTVLCLFVPALRPSLFHVWTTDSFLLTTDLLRALEKIARPWLVQ